jgi:Necrosis inducing protein (NPP1)
VALAAMTSVAHARVLRWLPHNQIASIRQDVTDYQWKFQPNLIVAGGCVPFPAVDWWGNLGGGLNPTGSPSGKCSHSSGQVYVRALMFNGDCAVMYSWYFPKDQVLQGHRHDWENIVVWLSECSTRAWVKAVSYSAHGGYEKETRYIPMYGGTHPKVNYGTAGILNRSLSPTWESGGGWHPAIRYWGLSREARLALSYASFGSANVPFIDENFWVNLRKAWYR